MQINKTICSLCGEVIEDSNAEIDKPYLSLIDHGIQKPLEGKIGYSYELCQKHGKQIIDLVKENKIKINP